MNAHAGAGAAALLATPLSCPAQTASTSPLTDCCCWWLLLSAGTVDANRVQNVCTSAYKFLLVLLATSQPGSLHTLFLFLCSARCCQYLHLRSISRFFFLVRSSSIAIVAVPTTTSLLLLLPLLLAYTVYINIFSTQHISLHKFTFKLNFKCSLK